MTLTFIIQYFVVFRRCACTDSKFVWRQYSSRFIRAKQIFVNLVRTVPILVSLFAESSLLTDLRDKKLIKLQHVTSWKSTKAFAVALHGTSKCSHVRTCRYTVYQVILKFCKLIFYDIYSCNVTRLAFQLHKLKLEINCDYSIICLV